MYVYVHVSETGLPVHVEARHPAPGGKRQYVQATQISQAKTSHCASYWLAEVLNEVGRPAGLAEELFAKYRTVLLTTYAGELWA